jgi:trk system potassium uptake protein TrkA
LADTPSLKRVRREHEVLVIGLGRFGAALADTLVSLGHDVLGVDTDPNLVQEQAAILTNVLEADATNPETLRQIGANEFQHVVVAIGEVEASVLTVAELIAMGVTDIWAKALNAQHARILERIGARKVVQPEHDAGARMAHQVTGRVKEYIRLDEGFALVESEAPAEIVGKTLGEAGVRARYGVTIVCIKPPGGSFTYATPETVIEDGSILLVAGEGDRAEAFAERD